MNDKEQTLNMFDPDKKKTIWDPNSEFMQELQIYKLKSEIKPRKTNMMQAQVGMMQDMYAEQKKKKLFVPDGNGGFVR